MLVKKYKIFNITLFYRCKIHEKILKYFNNGWTFRDFSFSELTNICNADSPRLKIAKKYITVYSFS